MKNISLEKLYTKCDGETSPKSLFKRSKLSISQDQQSEIVYCVLLLYGQIKDYQNILKLNTDHFPLPNKILIIIGLKLISLPHFLHYGGSEEVIRNVSFSENFAYVLNG